MDAKQAALARAVLEVGLTRHRNHPRLRQLQLELQEFWYEAPADGVSQDRP